MLHFALIDHTLAEPPPRKEIVRWMAVSEATSADLAFDHSLLLHKALDRLRNKTRYTALPVRLMQEQFTLSELPRVFETVLGTVLEKKSFRRRVLDAHIVTKVGEQRTTGARPAALFRVDAMPADFTFPRPLEG
jgi:8-oxo-dGTP diphosphatase